MVRAPAGALGGLGRQLSFFVRALGWTYRVLLRYKTEVARLLAEASLGTAALAVIGGTVAVVGFITLTVGGVIGLQAFNTLADIGVSALAGFVTAFFNTRGGVPVATGAALAATVGAGFTSQLGMMRINEEIDALEVMGVPSVPFVVTTRIIAGLVAVIPLYFLGLLASYTASQLIITVFYEQAVGTYAHYFNSFLYPFDILVSFVKVMLMALVIMLVSCYYGYTAAGGPEGIGRAVGRAVRASIIAVVIVKLFVDMAVYGGRDAVNIAG